MTPEEAITTLTKSEKLRKKVITFLQDWANERLYNILYKELGKTREVGKGSYFYFSEVPKLADQCTGISTTMRLFLFTYDAPKFLQKLSGQQHLLSEQRLVKMIKFAKKEMEEGNVTKES